MSPILKVIGSDYEEIFPGDKVPARGLAMKGGLVYEDGRLLGVATSTPAHAAVEFVLERRGCTVEIRYRPLAEALGEAA